MKRTMLLSVLMAAGISISSAQEIDPDAYNDVEPAPGLATRRHVDPESAMEMFARVDTNKDGKLSVSEADAALPDAGIKDANNDGFLSVAEAKASLDDFDVDSIETDPEIPGNGVPGISGIDESDENDGDDKIIGVDEYPTVARAVRAHIE